MKQFVGRNEEVKKLEDLFHAPRAILAVIKGRRRIGQSRLVKEFAVGKVFHAFTGLAPTNSVSAQDKRNHFARKFYSHFGLPPLNV